MFVINYYMIKQHPVFYHRVQIRIFLRKFANLLCQFLSFSLLHIQDINRFFRQVLIFSTSICLKGIYKIQTQSSK